MIKEKKKPTKTAPARDRTAKILAKFQMFQQLKREIMLYYYHYYREKITIKREENETKGMIRLRLHF